MAAMLARFPGNVMGSPEDMIRPVNIARQAGRCRRQRRSDEWAAGVQPHHRLPEGGQPGAADHAGTPVSQIASTIGGFSANAGPSSRPRITRAVPSP